MQVCIVLPARCASKHVQGAAADRRRVAVDADRQLAGARDLRPLQRREVTGVQSVAGGLAERHTGATEQHQVAAVKQRRVRRQLNRHRAARLQLTPATSRQVEPP